MARNPVRRTPFARPGREFGRIDPAKMLAINFWKLDIAKIQPGFEVIFVRDIDRKIVKARFRGLPDTVPGPGDMHSFDELYKEMESLAIYYQVGRPWERPAAPPPGWLAPEAQEFWERAALRRIPMGNYICRYGPPLSGKLVLPDGTVEHYRTRMQLLWVHAEPSSIKVHAFHYIPPDIAAGDSAILGAITDWNGSMYSYIEQKKLRPDVARDQLAMVNQELHKALMKGVFRTARRGRGPGRMPSAWRKIAKHAAKKTQDAMEWLEKWYSEEDRPDHE